jgi:DMSO/TMAO reductase YedYZ molybdopterin-dependent catalytic subunit
MMRIRKHGVRLLLIIVLSMVIFGSSCGQFSANSTTTPRNPNDLTYLASLDGSELAAFDNSKLPVTSIEDLHVKNYGPKSIDIKNYHLTVDGLVDKPLTLTYGEILRYPTVTQVVLMVCPTYFADNAEWTGVLVSTLLAEAGVTPKAKQITFYGLDGYHRSLSLTEAQSDGVFLAYIVDGQVLPNEHGYPVRLVVKGVFGDRWVKWVNHIKIS